MTALAADLTHRWIEKPISSQNYSSTQIFRASTIATLTCSLIGISILATDQSSISIGNGRSVSISAIKAKPDVYMDGCHVNNGEVLSPECTYGDLSASKTIVLYGDSHAAQWFPALENLAKDKGFKLVSLTKSACPAPEVRKVQVGAYKNADCFKWRENSIKRIKQLRPDAVILSGYQHFQVPSQYQSRSIWWAEGQRATFQHLQGLSPKLIYISDTPKPSRDIPNCLASNGGAKCNENEKSDPQISGNFIKVNPTPWLCTSNCPAVVNGIVAYRDASHISVDISRALSPKLGTVLADLGLL
ncbi:unannotated protein [freshwater metagenome]|uniref:Unannotated protein n=1 Tax=freshwater metagenome TaxID=449393 RepID=A0A6J6B7P7_9ZZZZ